MKQIGDIVSDFASVEVGIRCRKCGAVPLLVGNQYSVRCVVCGTLITVTPNYLAALKAREYQARTGRPLHLVPRCRLCRDNGYVIIEQQVDARLYDYAYRCICQAGQRRADLSGWPVLPEELARQHQVQQDWSDDGGQAISVPTTRDAEDRGTGSARL